MKTICITCKADCHNAGTMARIIECSSYEPGRILTNADRIRAMSDEELVTFLERVHDNPRDACCGNWGQCRRNNAPEPVCQKHFLKWLQQPAEEDT